MKKTRSQLEPWLDLERRYNKLVVVQHESQIDAVLLLKKIRDEEPWRDRSRYVSEAAWESLRTWSFFQIVHRRLGGSVRVVNRALRALDQCGEDLLRAHSLQTCVAVTQRVKDVSKRTAAFEALAAARGAHPRRALSSGVTSRILNGFASKIRRVKTDVVLVKNLRVENARLKAQLNDLSARACPECGYKKATRQRAVA